MKRFVEIAESIMDAREFLEENTASAENVQLYAENGMGIQITRKQAEKIRQAILAWETGSENGELNGTNDYYYTVINPLTEIGGE